MATQPDKLIGDPVQQTQPLRFFPDHDGVRPGTFAAVAADVEIPHGTPVSFDSSTDNWKIWDDPVNEVFTITSNATPATAGDFTLTFAGEETAAIAFDADADAVQAALEALAAIDPGDVAAVQTSGTDLGDASAVVTITMGGKYTGEAVALTADFSGLTGNAHALANPTDGSGDQTSQIDGFVYSPAGPITLLLAGETIHQIFRKGSVHRDDVPLPTTSSQTQGALDVALRDQSLRMKNIEVLGLANVH